VLYKPGAKANPRGHATKQGILEVASAIAKRRRARGADSWPLATDLSMSKSGLFAHFGSKEELQLATIEHARQIYVEQVILPGLAAFAGQSRRSRDFAIATLPSWSDVSFRAVLFRGGHG